MTQRVAIQIIGATAVDGYRPELAWSCRDYAAQPGQAFSPIV